MIRPDASKITPLTLHAQLLSMASMRSFLLVSFLGVAACGGPSFESLCDRLGDECGVPEAEVAECKQFAGLVTNAAEEAGCEAELDDYLACIDSAEDFCSQNLGDDCSAEEDALDECGEVASGGGEQDPPG
jgi:hypothetical protein